MWFQGVVAEGGAMWLCFGGQRVVLVHMDKWWMGNGGAVPNQVWLEPGSVSSGVYMRGKFGVSGGS